MFSGASNFTRGTDTAFMFIFGIDLFFLILLTVIMIVFVVKYNRKRHPKATQIKDHMWLEITWTVVPVLLVLMMFYYGYIAFQPMEKAPKDSIPVKTTGRMWQWLFEYSNGKKSDILIVPLNKPIRLNLESADVVHSLYIPAFRIKQDAVPGKHYMMWFIPERLGEYDIMCAEYCGLRHSYMESKVKVVPEEEYNKWLTTISSKSVSPAEEGLVILKNNACTSCHSLDGTKLVSVSFKGLFGKKETVITNNAERTVIADSTYIVRSIYDPDFDVVKGYTKGLMKTYKGLINDVEMSKIIAYLKGLNEKK